MSAIRRLLGRRPSPFEPQERYYGLSEARFRMLTDYEAERARGLVHTAKWQERMAVLAAEYEEGRRAYVQRQQRGGRQSRGRWHRVGPGNYQRVGTARRRPQISVLKTLTSPSRPGSL